MSRDLDHPSTRAVLYRTVDAPHETAAVLRLHRAGMSGPKLMKFLRLRATGLMAKLQQAMDMERDAHRRGLPIHDALIPKGTK